MSIYPYAFMNYYWMVLMIDFLPNNKIILNGLIMHFVTPFELAY